MNSLTRRQKNWIGALTSIAIQTALFIPIQSLLGDWLTASIVLLTNIGLALTYKSSNPYLTGARWATFWALGLASWARHSYWYYDMLDSFIRLRDFNHPVEWNEVFCKATLVDVIVIGTTSALIVVFYSITTRWPEWTDRWEMLRRAPFSASLGFQVLIVTAVVYPTPLTLTSALFFSAIISPIIRRQVRLNHIVFMMLVPLFCLGCPPLALFWGAVTGLIFLYWTGMERSLSPRSAAFCFFNGVVFLALTVSLVENKVLEEAPSTLGGMYALLSFFLLMGVSYGMIVYSERVIPLLQKASDGITPRAMKEARWWSIRNHWVDREVDCRIYKRYDFKSLKKDLGFFFFGPKQWASGSENYEKVSLTKVNLVPAILALTFYALWLAVDAVLALTNGIKWVTLLEFALAFLVTLGVPVLLAIFLLKKRLLGKGLSLAATGGTFVLLTTFMSVIFVAGLSSSDQLSTAAAQAQSRQEAAVGKSIFGCRYSGEKILLNGSLFR